MPGDIEKKGPGLSATPVGQYYLLDRIAQGGMAEIYKGLAYDLHGIKRTVVIKKILPEISADPEFVGMLINEAKIAVMLSHGNIAQIYDLGKVGNDYFMVMEYVDGQSLSKIHKRCLRNGSLIPIEYTCYFISEVANGLNYMHRRTDEQGRNLGIIHRDISPQNVIVSYSGTVKIIDFGIAKASIQMRITDSGILKGKFAYMSPEQALGEFVDHRTDIFSLGVILYELLTGKRLFKGKDKRETLQNVRRCDVAPPSTFTHGIPPELDRITLKALAKDPKDRYMWASDLHDDLIRFIYTHYPEFQPSFITKFIRELFEKDISEAEEAEEEAKTPLLIIDHTQSAILPEKMEVTGKTRIPPQLREFMLDEETPLPEPVETAEEEKKEATPKKLIPFIKRRWKKCASIGGGTLLALSLIYAAAAKLSLIKPPAYLSWLEPITTLVLNIEPNDTELSFGGEKIKGEKKMKLKNITPGVDYQLIVEKGGYLPHFETVNLKKGEKRVLNIILAPEPPHYGTLTITSEPEGATIFINNENTNQLTPATIKVFRPDVYYSIGLYLDGHKYWGRDIVFKPDEEKMLNATLEKIYGEIEIISSPPGAAVAIDGKPAGVTPLQLKRLDIGKVLEITVSKSGYTTFSQKVKIKEGGATRLRPNLARTKELLVPDYLRDALKPPAPPEETDTKEGTPDLLPPAPVE